jgi:hypothetical protein
MTPRSTSAGPFRCRAHGRPAYSSTGFLRRESKILRACAAGGSEWGRPAGTSEQRDRASDLLRRESECCRNESGLLRRERERESGVGRRTLRRAITTHVSDVRKKATLGGNQRRRVLRNERNQLGRQQRRCILTNMRL